MNENRNWRKTITTQVRELPVLEKMLNQALHEKKDVSSGKLTMEDHFCRQLSVQQQDMKKLSNEIDDQQKRLAKDCENEIESRYDIDALCTQDILRERIKAIEKNYIDLKCNFMNFLSTLL